MFYPIAVSRNNKLTLDEALYEFYYYHIYVSK